MKFFIKNSFFLVTAEFFSLVLGFLLQILIAKNYSVADFGKFTFALTLAGIFTVIINFGFEPLVTQKLSQQKKTQQNFCNGVLTIKFFLSLLIFIGFVVFALINKNLNSFIFFMPFLFFSFFNSFNEFFRAIFRSYKKFSFEAITKILEKIILFCFGLFFLQFSIKKIGFPYLLSTLFVLIIFIFYLKKIHINLKFKFYLKDLKKIFFTVSPYFLANIFSFLYLRINIFYLSYLQNDFAVGIFGVAQNLALTFNFVPFGIMTVFFPFLSQKKFFHNYAKISLKFICAVAFILIPILFFSADFIIKLFYSEEYIDAIKIFRILITSQAVVAFSMMFMFWLQALEKQKIYTTITIINFCLTAILSFFLVKNFSYQGAAYSILFTEIFSCVVMLIYFLKYFLCKKQQF